MSKQMTGGGLGSKMAAMKDLAGEVDPASMAGMGGMTGRGSTKTKSNKQRFKRRKRK